VASATETIAVSYRTDAIADYTPMGTVTASGRTVLNFDGGGVEDEGLEFRWVQFRLDFARDAGDATKSPVLDSIVLNFQKLPNRANKSWTLPLRVDFEEQWMGRTNWDMSEHLDELTTTRRYTTFRPFKEDDDYTFRVYVAQVKGPQGTGLDDRGRREVNIVEVAADA
jgi:hypothetical protein